MPGVPDSGTTGAAGAALPSAALPSAGIPDPGTTGAAGTTLPPGTCPAPGKMLKGDAGGGIAKNDGTKHAPDPDGTKDAYQA